MKVAFITPGELDIRAITVFGVNAKPNATNPIGFFGTGLKYAIATLMRTNHKVTVYIGTAAYIFQRSQEEFRGTEFSFLWMRKERQGIFKKRIQLPFTEELGKHWELWQAFRELHSNTLDELGNTTTLEEGTEYHPESGQTAIIVEGDDFVQEYLDREKTFLPDALRKQSDETEVQMFKRPSKHVYYRGIRVMDLEDGRESIYTYNILSYLDLTEDRTAKYEFMVRFKIAELHIDSEDKEHIEEVITAPARSLESQLDFTNFIPSEVFLDVVETHRRHSHNPHIDEVFRSHRAPKEVESVKKPSEWLNELYSILNDATSGNCSWNILHNWVVAAAPELMTALEKTLNKDDEIPF